MYGLSNVTHGEVWHQRKLDLVVKDHDPGHMQKMPKRMTREDAFKYYNAKINCVFGELGFIEEPEELFHRAWLYKEMRKQICDTSRF